MPIAKTCLPSFLKLMDSVFAGNWSSYFRQSRGPMHCNVTGKVRLIVYNGAKLTLKFIHSEEATKL